MNPYEQMKEALKAIIDAGCIHDEGGYCTAFDRPCEKDTCNEFCCEYESEGGGDAE